MLEKKVSKKIIELVYLRPRSIQEIAQHIQKNWRTANSYVEKIAREEGTIAITTFREGTRGALKIVYWNNVEKIHSNDFQERLFRKIEVAKTKNDFSPFDIYQYVEQDKRAAFLEEQSEYTVTEKQDLVGALRKASRQILIFSGDLSWINAKQGKTKLVDVFTELLEKGVSIKILCRVNLESMNKIQKAIGINESLKSKLLEIRHAEQAFRAFLIDDEFVRFKELREGNTKKKKNTYIFYDIMDSEWIAWIQKIFWHFFRQSIQAQKRIEDIETIKRIKM